MAQVYSVPTHTLTYAVPSGLMQALPASQAGNVLISRAPPPLVSKPGPAVVPMQAPLMRGYIMPPVQEEYRVPPVVSVQHPPVVSSKRLEIVGTKQPVQQEHANRGSGNHEAFVQLSNAIGGAPGKLVAFDFDKTIMKVHMFAQFKYRPVEEIPVTDDMFADLSRFRSIVRACVTHGHRVAVVTFGRKDVVEKALCHALGQNHGVDIKTPADFGVPDGSGALGDKNTQLAYLAQQYGMAASQIILVDDDKQNIDAAEKAGVAVHWAPQGLNKMMTSMVATDVSPSVYMEMKNLDGQPIVSLQKLPPAEPKLAKARDLEKTKVEDTAKPQKTKDKARKQTSVEHCICC